MMDNKEKMIEYHLKARGIEDEKVLQAMERVDRELFVPIEMKAHAYDDSPLPIGRGQTISQPYIVAYMAEALDIQPTDKVLEIGSGCGYNAAVLAQMAKQVYSVEIIEWLSNLAKKNLLHAGVTNVDIRFGDGYQGWEEQAPYDKIILTAAAPKIPEPLKKQLRVGGLLLGPVSDSYQKLLLLKKTGEDEFTQHELLPVRFVPMTGQSQQE
ncbi:MAG: protein-L-isoaspartate(D-aspartate) O-methyltransferase [Bacteroidales bacterium]